MALWKCAVCGAEVEARCKPGKCKNCGAARRPAGERSPGRYQEKGILNPVPQKYNYHITHWKIRIKTFSGECAAAVR